MSIGTTHSVNPDGLRAMIWEYHKSIDGAVRLPDGSTLIASQPMLLISVVPVKLVTAERS